MAPPFSLFATAPRGTEDLLATELTELGAISVKEEVAGVSFTGDLATAYRACLWSRVASRILLSLTQFTATNADELYRGVGQVDWARHLAAHGTLAVDCKMRGRSELRHSHFVALKSKDAIVDQLRNRFGRRPSIDLERPDLRVHVFVDGRQVSLSLDLAGTPLHQRGYRERGVAAPLKENLAAAILLRARWPAVAAAGGSLCDPMCGSGTLLVEGALMAADAAPGWARSYWGFTGWRGHQRDLWRRLLRDARQRRERGWEHLPVILGRDHDSRALEVALGNLDRARLAQQVRLEEAAVDICPPPGDDMPPGLVVTNPPYGERIAAAGGLELLYADLGHCLRHKFRGWRAAVFSADEDLLRLIGMRPHKRHTLYNGSLRCRLLHYHVGGGLLFERDV